MNSSRFFIFVAINLLASCGGGGGDNSGGVSYEPATSPSYSPTHALNKAGKPANIYWKYRLNQGLPISSSSPTTAISITPIDLTLSINADELYRYSTFKGSMTGSSQGRLMNGTYSVNTTETLEDNSVSTIIPSVDAIINISMHSEGESVTVNISSSVDYSPPTEWFLGKTNLDVLGINYQENIATTGFVTTTTRITGETPETTTDNISSSERWRIVEFKTSETVLGKTYNDVVVVERYTQIPQINGIFLTMVPITITYYVAKGIGMIKGVDYMNVSGQSLDVELLETNLQPPTIVE